MANQSKQACVIGDPIAHSLSPLIHSHWLSEYGLKGSYTAEHIVAQNFETFMENARLGTASLIGGNVTLPHKQALVEFADQVEPVAAEIGAANTFWIKEGKIACTNTDAYGFITNLDDTQSNWRSNISKNRCAMIIGAGGASRAVLYGLLEAGIKKFIIVNRNQQRAYELLQSFEKHIAANGAVAQVISYDEFEQNLSSADLLVNTSSLGMHGQPLLELNLENLPTHTLVTDIVYIPLMTELLQNAKRKGNPIVDGLGMLLHQAVPGFEKWFGIKPSVTAELRAKLIKRLNAS